MNRYGLRNYSNDPIPDPSATCPGNKGASIPGNSGQIVGFNSGDEYIRPTFKQPPFPQNQKEKRSLATTALSVPLAASPMLPIVFFLSAVRDPTPFPNQLSSPCSTIETLCAIPGDPYSDSNKSPINTWDKTVMDWNKKNKRAAKLARRKFLHRLHGSE